MGAKRYRNGYVVVRGVGGGRQRRGNLLLLRCRVAGDTPRTPGHYVSVKVTLCTQTTPPLLPLLHHYSTTT